MKRNLSNFRLPLSWFLLGGYFCLAPVCWLPWKVDYEMAALLKCAMATLLFGINGKQLVKMIFQKDGNDSLLGLLLLLGSLFLLTGLQMLRGQAWQSIVNWKHLATYGYGVGTVWVVAALYSSYPEPVVRVLKLGLISVAALSFFTLTNRWFRFPTWSAPQFLPLDTHLMLAGFSFHKNGWSNSIAFYVPLVALFLNEKSNRPRHFMVAGLLVFPILLSQFYVSGRAGLLASGLSLFVLLWTGHRKMLLGMLPAGVLMAGLNFDYIFTHLRFDRELTSGRIDQYALFFKGFLEKPRWGWGFSGAGRFLRMNGVNHPMHNEWFRIFLDFGVFNGMLSMVFIGYVVYLIRRMHRRQPETKALNFAVSFVLINGFVISLFEPLAILGAYQLWFPWWVCLGILAVRARARRSRPMSLS